MQTDSAARDSCLPEDDPNTQAVVKLLFSRVDAAFAHAARIQAHASRLEAMLFEEFQLLKRQTISQARARDSTRTKLRLLLLDAHQPAKNVVGWVSRKMLGKQENSLRLSRTERRQIDVIRLSGWLDREYYLERYPDVGKAYLEPAAHYYVFGAVEGRDPHPLFDTNFYKTTYPDVVQARLNPLYHFVRWGLSERRIPHPLIAAVIG